MDVDSGLHFSKDRQAKAYAVADGTRRPGMCPRPLKLRIILVLLLMLGNIYGHAQQMRILRNQRIALRISGLPAASGNLKGVPVYARLVQDVPYVEVQLTHPLPASRVHPGRMLFQCEEVGVFDGGSSIWTIGKRCRPR